MPADVTVILRKALSELQSQQARLDRQIIALHAALGGDAASPAAMGPASRPARKRRMSAAARRAVGVRMKAYWAKRRDASSPKTGTAPKKRVSARRKPKKR